MLDCRFFKKISKLVFFIPLALLFLICSGKTSIADEISAKAAVLMDSSDETILYAKNPDLKLPPASTAKLVTAMVVLDVLDAEAVTKVSRKAANTSSVEPHFRIGQTISIRDLLHLALMKSVNGAAVALAEATANSEKAFVDMMNKKAQSIGATNTRFINASGLPGRNQYTTARDLAKLLKESLKYPLISEIINTKFKMLDVGKKPTLLKNTNYMLWFDEDQIGGKTGYTRKARHCLVSASRNGDKTLIVALLGERTRKRLWDDTKKLLDKGYEMLNTKNDEGSKQSTANNYSLKKS